MIRKQVHIMVGYVDTSGMNVKGEMPHILQKHIYRNNRAVVAAEKHKTHVQ